MNTFRTALAVELHKALAARVLRVTTVFVVAGIAALTGSLVAAAQSGNEQILAQLGPLAIATGWPLLTGISAQITAVGALLAFGVALSWTVGREFSDGTVTGLFAIPVPRHMIALAKMCIHLVWVGAVALILTTLLLAAGLILGLGPADGQVAGQLVRQAVLTLVTGMIATPAAWAATLGQGLLPGIAATLGILIAAQVIAIAAPSAAGWIPFSVGALWALQPAGVPAVQLAIVAIVPIGSAVLTVLTWRRLQLDR